MFHYIHNFWFQDIRKHLVRLPFCSTLYHDSSGLFVCCFSFCSLVTRLKVKIKLAPNSKIPICTQLWLASKVGYLKLNTEVK